jgi:hypothetical protein
MPHMLRPPAAAAGFALLSDGHDPAELGGAGRDDHQRAGNREVLDEQRTLGLVGQIEMKHKGGSATKQGQRTR